MSTLIGISDINHIFKKYLNYNSLHILTFKCQVIIYFTYYKFKIFTKLNYNDSW